MSQATLGGAYRNSNLFSNYYLEEKVYGLDAWDCDEAAQEAFDALQELYTAEGGAVPTYDEDNLRTRWIDEVLDVLGYATLNEASMPSGGGFVDRLLLESDDDARDAAMLEQDGQHTAMYRRGLGILEAKQWGADFSRKFSEGRNYHDASNQIKYYLDKTPGSIRWGILTDGKKWRLYGTKDYETETYYEVDLQELLESGTLEDFKRFFVFFRADALRESGDTTFLDEVWSESETAAEELGEDLQDDVFTALRIVGRGFVEYNDLDIDPADEEDLDELKEQSLVLLYRLMFILYAEARDLINPDDPDARAAYEEDYSLDSLRQDIHDDLDGTADYEREFSERSPSMWDRLTRLFDLIDTGNEKLGVPAYNGGLFDPDEHAFLEQYDLPNRHLAEAIHRISTTTSESGEVVLADYADLDTRHLGSIYEGLLEHQFRVAPEPMAAVREDGAQVWKPADEVTVADAVETVEAGDLYVVNDDGERKATGAYYTPDYVVSYIVEETIDPLLDDIREDVDGAFKSDSDYVQEFMQGVKELKILDPAMGSGHFLTAATRYLTEQVMAEAREREVTVLDESHIRRTFAKECIYGVDINEMAVELAKLSMWLETLAANQPLAFLDHHLKCGNSLVGADIEEIEELESEKSESRPESESTLGEFGVTWEGTREQLMQVYQDLLAIENESLDDIKRMERKYSEIQSDELRQRLLSIANVRTAERFEVSVPDSAYSEMAEALNNTAKWQNIKNRDWFRSAQKSADEKSAFHWKIEFPEAFYDESGNELDAAGFDVVLGNPPYLNAWTMTEKMPDLREGIKKIYADEDILEGHWDLFVPFVSKAIDLTADGGHHSYILPNLFLTEKYSKELRKHLLSEHGVTSILDFDEKEVFTGIDRQCCIYTVEIGAKNPDEHSLRNCESISPFIWSEISRASSETWLNVYNYQIRVDKTFVDESLPIINRIDSEYDKLGQYLYVNVGATVSSEEPGKFSKSDVVGDEPTGNAKKFFQGTDLQRYQIEWNGEWLDYRHSEMSGPRSPEMFEAAKVVIRVRTNKGGVLAAAYDEGGLYCDHTVLVCCKYESLEGSSANIDFEGFNRKNLENPHPRFFTGIINSNLLTWVFKNKFETGGLQGSYSDVWPQSVRSFPIPDLESNHPIGANLTEEAEKLLPVDNLPESGLNLVSRLSRHICETKQERQRTNLHLPDYLGTYDDGPTLADLGPIPPEGRADSLITDTEDEAEGLDKLRIDDVTVERDGDTLTLSIVPYVKPEDPDDYDGEPNQHGYLTLDPVPAMRFTDLDADMADLIESFVPYAVDEAGGTAGFRDNATSTISPLDRLEALTLPTLADVRDGLDTYREQVERAAELDAQIERTDNLIDEIVYDLYGLTDEEIAIVEEAVGD